MIRVWGGLEGQGGGGLATSKRQCKPHYSIILLEDSSYLYALVFQKWDTLPSLVSWEVILIQVITIHSNHSFLYEANLCGVT